MYFLSRFLSGPENFVVIFPIYVILTDTKQEVKFMNDTVGVVLSPSDIL
jgi:hypothetical protein